MSIQDDIFDVQDSLEREADKEAFDRIINWAGGLETENNELGKENNTLREAIKIVKDT